MSASDPLVREITPSAADLGQIRMALIPADGTQVMLAHVKPGDYKAMAELIGAEYIEHVVTIDGAWAMAVDKEGLLRGKKPNRRASMLYAGGSTIVGDALLARQAYVGDAMDWVDTEPGDLLLFLSQRGALQ